MGGRLRRRQPKNTRENRARLRRGRKESRADQTDTPCRSPIGRPLFLGHGSPRQPAKRKRKPFSFPGQTRRPRPAKSRVSGPTHSPPTDRGLLPGSRQPPRRPRPHGACWESRYPALLDPLPFGIPLGTPWGSIAAGAQAPHPQLRETQRCAHRVSRREPRSALSAPPHPVPGSLLSDRQRRREPQPGRRCAGALAQHLSPVRSRRAGPARGLRAAEARTSARRAGHVGSRRSQCAWPRRLVWG